LNLGPYDKKMTSASDQLKILKDSLMVINAKLQSFAFNSLQPVATRTDSNKQERVDTKVTHDANNRDLEEEKLPY
jgi:hypothetical protein